MHQHGSLLHLSDASKRLLICERTLRTLIKSGYIRSILVGRQVRISERQLDEFISRGGCRKRKKGVAKRQRESK
jgi:excisionase family DNA binding protein